MTSPRQLTIVAPGGRDNPSARVRALAWADRLCGVEVDSATYLDTSDVRPATLLRHAEQIPGAEKRLRELAREARSGTLLLQREASPLSRGDIERRLLGGAAHGVFDIDDALYVVRGRASPRRLLRSHEKPASLASRADMVIAGSDTLADWAREVARRVVRIPSCIDLDDYDPKIDHGIKGRPTVLWIGSATTEPHLRSVASALGIVAREVPLRLLLIGAAQGRLSRGLETLTERRPWSASTVRAAVAEADVGIMPLPDDPFTRGKCAYKLLQYAAAALPVIGSPVGASGDFLRAAGAPTPTSTAEWVDSMRQLLTAPAQVRRDLGVDARKVVEQRYTYDVWQEEWCDAVLPSR